MIALRSGRAPTDHWVREEVDLLEEHRRGFGWVPVNALALAVMTDSDALCARASAEFADFRLSPRRVPPIQTPARERSRNHPRPSDSTPNEENP